MKEELLPLDAEERIRRMKKAIRGQDAYQPYTEYKMMEKFGIGHDELMDFPYEKFLEYAKLSSLEAKYEQKKSQEMQSQADT